MINSIGLPNKGLEGYLAHDLPELAQLPVPLIVNVMGFTREQVATLVSAFAERDEVSGLELNVSCPNVETGMIMGADPAETAALVDAVRPLTRKPLIVKLTPNCTSPADVAAAAEAHGADAVSLVNTIRGMAFHPRRTRASRGSAAARVACRGRRSARSRSRRSRRSARGSRSRSSEWAASRADVMPTTCCRRAPMWWPSERSRFVTRWPARGWPPSSRKSQQTAGSRRPVRPAGTRAIAHNA